MRHSKSTKFNFRAPLSTPVSKHTELCYASHGKGFAHTPPRHSDINILLINESCATQWVPGHYADQHKYACPGFEQDEGWRRLGWRMRDGSTPLGEHDLVDPELAQFEYLPMPHSVAHRFE